MHILIAALGLIGVAAFWWYRLKMMHEAASDVADKVGRLRGSYRRKRLRKQSSLSPLMAIDRAPVAAATVTVAIVSEGGMLTPGREAALRDALKEIDEEDRIDEAVIYAKWAVTQIPEVSTVIDATGKFLAGRLDDVEKQQLTRLVRRVATVDHVPLPMLEPNLRRLRQRLGIEIN